MKKLLAATLFALASSVALAQPAKPIAPEDPFARYLYSPDLILDHQVAIKLSAEAKLQIQTSMADAQMKFLNYQFAMGKEAEALKELLRAGKADSTAILKQVDRMLGIEREVKHTQLSLMIKIKNTLTPEQQAALDKIRDAGRPDGGAER